MAHEARLYNLGRKIYAVQQMVSPAMTGRPTQS